MQPAIKFNPLSSHHTKYIDLCPKTKCHNLELSNDEFISPFPPKLHPQQQTPLCRAGHLSALFRHSRDEHEESWPKQVVKKDNSPSVQLTFAREHTYTRTHVSQNINLPVSMCSPRKNAEKTLYGKEKQNVNEPKVREAKWWEGESERVRRKNLASVKSKVSRARSAQTYTHTHTRTWCGESHSSVLNNALGFAKVRTKVRESGERAREVSEKIDWRSTPRKEQRASAHFGERFSSPLWADFLTAVRPNRSMRERERESSCKSNNCFGSRTRATTRGVCNSRLPLWTKHTGAAKTAWHRRVCVLESVKNR